MSKARLIARIALCTALIAVSAQISFPLPTGIPVTLQTFAIAFAAAFLGAKYGVVSVLCYLLLGACGVPVFAGFKSGFGALVGVTGGYLTGFLPMALLVGLAGNAKLPFAVLLCAAGLAACHFLGVLQFHFVAGTPMLAAFLKASAPYLVKDAVSVLGAVLLGKKLSSVLTPKGEDAATPA